jgi:ureidoacrylate peracid hydrolase
MTKLRNGAFSIEARPEPVVFDPMKTAVIVVDMQNFFASPGGTFHNLGVDVQPIQAIVPTIARILDGARTAGVKVVYLRMPVPQTPGRQIHDIKGLPGTPEIRWGAYLHSSVGQVRAANVVPPSDRPTWNADIVDGIEPHPEDIIVTKPSFGGFYKTELHEKLQSLGVADLVFTGCTTSVCVETTLREACMRGYRCLALADCMAEPIGSSFERTNHDATLHVIETLLAWVTDSTAFLHALEPPKLAALTE